MHRELFFLCIQRANVVIEKFLIAAYASGRLLLFSFQGLKSGIHALFHNREPARTKVEGVTSTVYSLYATNTCLYGPSQ